MKKSFKNLITLSVLIVGVFFISNYSSVFKGNFIQKVEAKVCSDGSLVKPIVTATTNINISAGGSVIPKSLSTGCFPQKAVFTLSPSTGYSINTVTGCGGTLNGVKYITDDLGVTGNCTVNISFVKDITYPNIISFTSDAPNNSVIKGSSTILRWNTAGATRCDLFGPGIDTKNDTTTKNNITSLTYPNGIGIKSFHKTFPLTKSSTFTLTCTDGNVNTSSSGATTKACYTGRWVVGDTVHPGGGRVTYTDGSNNSKTITGIWIGQTTIINYLNGTTPFIGAGANSISCTISNKDICDPITQCCYKNTSGFWIPGPPCA